MLPGVHRVYLDRTRVIGPYLEYAVCPLIQGFAPWYKGQQRVHIHTFHCSSVMNRLTHGKLRFWNPSAPDFFFFNAF